MKPETVRVFTDYRYFLAYGLGSGLAPRAPGTAGSLAALLIFYGLDAAGLLVFVAAIGAVFVVGIFVSDAVARDLGIKDPPGIVIDEFVGMWMTLLYHPAGWYWPLVGFALFRLFDIVKPWPVGWLDRHVEGGTGIMLDDVAAGLYALGVLQLAGFVVMRLTA